MYIQCVFRRISLGEKGIPLRVNARFKIKIVNRKKKKYKDYFA